MQIKGEGGVTRRETTKLVIIFLCHGGRRWPNHRLTLVMRILSPGHWVCLVSGWPSTSLALAGRTSHKQRCWRPWASSQPVSALSLYFHFSAWTPLPSGGNAQFSVVGRVQPLPVFSNPLPSNIMLKQGSLRIPASTRKLKITWKSPYKIERIILENTVCSAFLCC